MGITEFKIDNLKDYIEYLSKRPLMHMERKDIDLLEANINGFIIGKGLTTSFLPDFTEFVKLEFNILTVNISWKRLLLNVNKMDKQLAFDSFFELYDRFNKKIVHLTAPILHRTTLPQTKPMIQNKINITLETQLKQDFAALA